MQIVTDSGIDLALSPEQLTDLKIHVIPLTVTLDDMTYREGEDISPEQFYPLLEASGNMPATSQPSAGELAELYTTLAEDDPEIMSIHISSGLSGTYNAARLASGLVPGANITVVDSKTLSAAAGWQVEMAARTAKAGWGVQRIKSLLERISQATDSLYTLQELDFLVHGGRISHLKGLVGSVLKIKPVIGVEKHGGTYIQLGQVRTFKRAIAALVDQVAGHHAPGNALRVQVMHAHNPEAAGTLRDLMDERFECTWLPTGQISLVLGAHTGPSMVGLAYAPQALFDEVESVL